MTEVRSRVVDKPGASSIGLAKTMTVVFAITFIGFLLRTTGVHWDELLYLRTAAADRPFGDSAITGKPFLFYAINYAVMHTFGLVAGSLRPFLLPVFHAIAFSAALTWAVAALGGGASATAWRAVALAISPIALLNSTALMMETAALTLICVLVGCVALARSARAARYGLVVAAAAATAVKATTIPALLLLAWAFRDRLRRDVYLIAVGIVVGLAVNYAGLWIIAPKWQTYYGGVGELLSVTSIVGKLQNRGAAYLLLWLFMAGGLVVLITLFERRRWQDREFQVLVLGSLVGVGAMAAASVFEFARYCYPVIWSAVLGMLATSRHPGRGLLAGVIALHLVQGAPLFMHSPSRFSRWPGLVTVELVDSAGTTFSGFPIQGLTLRQILRDHRPCIWINAENGEKNEVLESFASHAFPQGRTYVSPRVDAGKPDSCSPANTIRVMREHVEGPQVGCSSDCGACRFQNIRYFFAKPGWVRNQVCWPGE